MNIDNPNESTRSLPTLAELRESLATERWNDSLTPAFEPISHPRVTDRLGRGYYGEDIMARRAASRAEIILEYGRGIEDTNKGGPDLVTLAETEKGLVVKFYDNKALTTRTNVSQVSALQNNFDSNLATLKHEWEKIAADVQRTDSERRLFATALSVVENKEEGGVIRIVTNANGRVAGLTSNVASSEVIFEDMTGSVDKVTPTKKMNSPL